MSGPIENPTPAEKQPAETTAPGQRGDDDGDKKFPLTTRGKWGVALLAIYLLFLLVLSLSWFTGLMFADTTAPENANLSLAKCIVEKKEAANIAEKKEAANKAAGAGNSNTNTANTNGNTNAAPATNTSNTATSNANRATNSTPANGNTTPSPKPVGTSNSNTANNEGSKDAPDKKKKTGEGEDEALNLNITRVVTVDKDSYLGSLFSVYSFTQNGCVTADGYLFLLVLFAGMIGAIIRALIYLCWRVGTEKFSFTWAWYYIFQPFMGAGMAIIVYAVIRGGFNGGAIGKGNIYAFVAVAFLTALFSDNAMAKLKLIAESLLVKVDRPKAAADDKKKDNSGAAGAGAADTPATPPAKPADAGGDSSAGGRTPGSMPPNEPPV